MVYFHAAGGAPSRRAAMQERFKKLIEEGEGFRADFLNGYKYRWYRYSRLNTGYVRWKQACLRLLLESFGADSPHYAELLSAEEDLAGRAPGSVFSFFLETMRRAAAEFRSPPPPPRTAFASDIVEDRLARAEALAARGHYLSAAVMAGEVLEDLLRRLCRARGVFCPDGASLDSVNDRLLEARVYGRPVHKEAALRIALRRSAELCYADKLNRANVGEMISWLRAFAGERFPSSPPPGIASAA